ncbi:hypothetical protein TWF281_004964 [Arthrobotrys megalospora]
MMSRLAQRKRPGFIHLPPASMRAVSVTNSPASGGGHAALLHDSPTSTNINSTTNPVSIPPVPRVSSPYYSPSQVFPPPAASNATKSYFPAYLSSQPSPSPRAGSVSTNSTPSPPVQTQNQPPKTPRSPSASSSSFFGAPSPLSAPSMSTATASAITSSPSTSKSRRTYHAHLAQQQLAFQMQQRDLIFQATRAASNTIGGPISPRLIPMGSPGPVTPLTLEDNPAGYLFSPSIQLQQHHLEKLAAAAEQAAAAAAAADEDSKAA